MMKTSVLPVADARAVVLDCFRDLVAETDKGIIPSTLDRDAEWHEQRCLSQERVLGLQEQRGKNEFDGGVRSATHQSLEAAGFDANALHPAERDKLYDGVARALIEQQRLFQFRLDDSLSPFRPTDTLFADTVGTPTTATTTLPSGSVSAAIGPTLADTLADYLSQRKKEWTDKTYRSRIRQLRYLEEHLGGGTFLSSINSHDIRGFKKAVCRLRTNHGAARKQTFAEKQTANDKRQIATKTATLIFEPCKAFFKWAADTEGYLEQNPAANVRMDAQASTKSKKRSRRPFTAAELATLFSAPVFTGHQSKSRRFEAGSVLEKDGKYWIPILGLYLGARLGEIVQLHIDDVDLGGAIPFIDINEDNTSGPGTENAKHVKSRAGIRKVPLHPDVLALGFADYVVRRRKINWKSKRLFPDITMGADGQASTTFSKWFRRLTTSVGLIDPALVFHSLRHGAEDAFRNASQPQYVIDKIIGHTDGATSAAYGEGVDLETAYEAVRSMKLKVSLLTLLQ